MSYYVDAGLGIKIYGSGNSFERWRKKYNTGRMAYHRAKIKYRGYRKKPPIGRFSNKKLREDIDRLRSGKTGAEWKSHDVTELSALNITNTGTLTCLTNISQGDTSLAREGLMIKLQSIQFKYTLASNTTHNGAHLIRVMLFFDTGNNNSGTDPTIGGDLLETVDEMAFKEKHVKGRYQVIYDKTCPINPNISGISVIRFKKYYKQFKKGRRIFYSGSVGTNRGKGQLWLMYMGVQGTNYPGISYNLRLKFTDR